MKMEVNFYSKFRANASSKSWYFFKNILNGDGERIIEPTIGYIHRAFEKLQKTDLLSNYAINRQNELLFIAY
jgi:hypothetical protein